MKEKLNLALYELKYAFLGMKRHLLLCLSAISAITISLFLIASFFLIGFHVDHFANNIQSDLSIHVILNPAIESQEQIDQIEAELKAFDTVDRVVFSDRDQELEMMIAEKGEAFSIYRGQENPLSNAFFVYVEDSKQLESTSKRIETVNGVISCAYGGDSVTSLVQLLDIVRKVGYGVAALLLLLSIYLIYNTIRSTIYSRQNEIIIMRQVGGTNAFIKHPFEVQGILIGLFGSLLPVVLISFGYPKLYEMLGGAFFANIFSLLPPELILWRLGLIIIAIGLLIGWFASFWAVTKYLKVKR